MPPATLVVMPIGRTSYCCILSMGYRLVRSSPLTENSPAEMSTLPHSAHFSGGARQASGKTRWDSFSLRTNTSRRQVSGRTINENFPPTPAAREVNALFQKLRWQTWCSASNKSLHNRAPWSIAACGSFTRDPVRWQHYFHSRPSRKPADRCRTELLYSKYGFV